MEPKQIEMRKVQAIAVFSEGLRAFSRHLASLLVLGSLELRIGYTRLLGWHSLSFMNSGNSSLTTSLFAASNRVSNKDKASNP
eukprot:1146976-Pelagomonas_calceolata.AAC.3